MNKLIVVTGGTKGIGRAVLEKFAANNFDIVTCSRNASDLESLSAAFQKTFPTIKTHVFVADMAARSEVVAFTKFVNDLKRPIDVLVNNAGYFVPGEICTEPDGVLEDMIHANLYSAYYTTRGIVGGMKAKKAGHIFNICSVASIKAYPNGGSYAIAKHAMLGFSKCLREELMDDGIRVTSVMPGATKTASWENTDLPDSRFMTAEDVAEAVFGAHALSTRSVVEEIVIRPLLGDI